jgi:MFS family permease
MMNALERRSTFALSSIFALRMLGLFMIIPVFSVAGQTYEYATPALLGLAVGIYGLTQAILQIPFSLIADRYSRKPLVVFGLLLFALGGAIAAMSDTIYGVIIGRAIAGGGAVSAVVMALLADVTREENRMKAMATMGMSIGVSFAVAFSLGPWLTGLVGISGLFWVTTIMGLAAISMLFLVPKVTRHHRNYQQGYLAQPKPVSKIYFDSKPKIRMPKPKIMPPIAVKKMPRILRYFSANTILGKAKNRLITNSGKYTQPCEFSGIFAKSMSCDGT